MRHLLYLMFRCNVDVMESLELRGVFFLNTALVTAPDPEVGTRPRQGSCQLPETKGHRPPRPRVPESRRPAGRRLRARPTPRCVARSLLGLLFLVPPVCWRSARASGSSRRLEGVSRTEGETKTMVRSACSRRISQERSAEIRIFFSFAASTFSARCQSVFSLSLLLKVLLVKWSSMSCRRQESRARTVEEAAAIWLLFSTKKNCYNDSLRLLQPRRVITYANTTIMICHC